MARLTKDSDGKIYVSIESSDQTDLCDYVILNGDRFNKETDYQRGTRLRETDPKTGHTYGCNCFICNH